MHTIDNLDALKKIYPEPVEAALIKVADRLTPQYRRLIEASPFVALASAGPEGLDCSPRGDQGQVAFVKDEKTLLILDRRGNNRIDTLKNIVRNRQVALLFLIPGLHMSVRVNGAACISIAPDLLAAYAVKGQPPRSVIVITIREIYFQCARALIRADLWNPEHHVSGQDLPSPGEVLKAQSQGRFDGAAYDSEWPARAAKTMW